MPPDPTALNKLIEILDPLTSEERQRNIAAAMAFLGEGQSASTNVAAEGEALGSGSGNFRDDVVKWMSKNNVTAGQLEHVFHITDDGGFELLEVPGRAKREKALNVYALVGLGTYLTKAGRHFSDDVARQACVKFACYDQGNHSATLKAARAYLAGDKKLGWTITAPGLKQAADLVKQVVGSGQ